MRILFSFLTILFVLASCASKSRNNTTLKSDFVNFVHHSEDILIFGYIDIESIIHKSELQESKELGLIVTSFIETFQRAIDTDDNLYIALKPASAKDEKDYQLFLFLKIKSHKELKRIFPELGIIPNEKQGKEFHIQDSLGIVYNEHTLMIALGGFGEKPEKTLLNAFKNSEKEATDELLEKFLDIKADITLVNSLERTYNFYSQNQKISKEEDELVKSYLKDGYYTFTTHFNAVDIHFNLDITQVSDPLKSFYFFNSSINHDFLNKITRNRSQTAAFLSLDMEKVAEVTKLFQGELSLANAFQSFGFVWKILEGIAEGDLSNLLSGDLLLVLDNESKGTLLSDLPDSPNMTLAIGAGKKGEELADMLEGYSSFGFVTKTEDGFYDLGDLRLKMDEEYTFILSDKRQENVEISNLPTEDSVKTADSEIFGRFPLTIYSDLKAIKSFDTDEVSKALVELTDFVIVYGDTRGIDARIVFINEETNVLKQVFREIEKKIGDFVKGNGF